MAATEAQNALPANEPFANPRRFRAALLPAILAPLPIWLTTFPPMVDIPQHVAQVRMFDDLLHGGWAYADFFSINLFTPYLMGYLVIWLLSKVVGLVAAAKIVVSLALAAMPASAAVALREWKSDPFWAWLVLPASYGFAFCWGFLNFIVAAPMGILYLLAAIRYARAPTVSSGIVIGILTYVLFFSHMLILLFFGALAGLYVLLNARSIRHAALALLPLLAVGPLGFLWGLPSLKEKQAQIPIGWDLGWHRLTDLPKLIMGWQNSWSMFLICLSLFVLPLLAGARLSRKPERYLPFALCLLVLALVPNLLVGGYFTYHRFAMFAVPLFLLCLEPPKTGLMPRQGRLLDACMVIVALTWFGMTLLRFSGYEKEGSDFQAVIDRMEPEKRVISLVFDHGSSYSPAPVFLHYGAWYQTQKGGIVDFNFAVNYGMLVRYTREKRPAIAQDFEWLPETINWDKHHVSEYDYLMLRSPPEQSTNPLADCRFEPVLHSGTWWLYVIRPDAKRGPVCATSEEAKPQSSR